MNHRLTERAPAAVEHRGFIPKVSAKHSIMTRLKQNHVQHSKPGFYRRKVFWTISTALSLYLLEESAPTGFFHGASRLCEQQRHRLNKIHSCLQCTLCLSEPYGSVSFCYFTLLLIHTSSGFEVKKCINWCARSPR